MPTEEQTTALFAAANAARKNAYVPFSGFKVGAAILAKSGNIYAGCNIENSSYGLTVCAERVAIFNAVSAGELAPVRQPEDGSIIRGKSAFEAMALIGGREKEGGEKVPVMLRPCGACLQVLYELAGDQLLILIRQPGAPPTQVRLEQLLPQAFSL